MKTSLQLKEFISPRYLISEVVDFDAVLKEFELFNEGITASDPKASLDMAKRFLLGLSNTWYTKKQQLLKHPAGTQSSSLQYFIGDLGIAINKLKHLQQTFDQTTADWIERNINEIERVIKAAQTYATVNDPEYFQLQDLNLNLENFPQQPSTETVTQF